MINLSPKPRIAEFINNFMAEPRRARWAMNRKLEYLKRSLPTPEQTERDLLFLLDKQDKLEYLQEQIQIEEEYIKTALSNYKSLRKAHNYDVCKVSIATIWNLSKCEKRLKMLKSQEKYARTGDIGGNVTQEQIDTAMESPIGDHIELKNNRAKCPLHNGNNPMSLYVDPEKNLYFCHSCGKSGNVINFLQELNSWDFKQTVRYLIGM